MLSSPRPRPTIINQELRLRMCHPPSSNRARQRWRASAISEERTAHYSSKMNMPVPDNARPAETKGRGCLDKVLLVLVALVICVVGGAGFWLAEDHHVNPAWVFFGWNSILIIPVLVRDFRGQLKRPSFLVFLLGWGIAHGLIV